MDVLQLFFTRHQLIKLIVVFLPHFLDNSSLYLLNLKKTNSCVILFSRAAQLWAR